MIYLAVIAAIIAIAAFVLRRKASRELDTYPARLEAFRSGPDARWGTPPEEPDSVPRTAAAVAVVAFAVMSAVFAVLSVTVVVSANEVGVPTTFGKIGNPIQSGISVVSPFTKVNKLPTRPVTVELTGDGSVRAATSQAGSYGVEISARWATDRENANKLYLQARTGDEDKISQDIVAKSLRQAVNDVYAGFTNVEANEKRATIAPFVSVRLSALMAPYGIDVTDVNLRSSVPDDKTKDAISSFAAEQQKTKVAEQAEKTAVAEAATRVATAKGIADAALQTAGLTAQEIEAAQLSAWERVLKYSADKGVGVYTSPFGGSSTDVLVAPKK